MKAVVFTAAGGNEVIRVEERPDPAVGAEDVLLHVRYAALNPADALQREGRYPAPPGNPADIPGLEVAGVVHAIGERVSAWRPGDRVFGLVGGGGLADRVVVHERAVARIPDALDDRLAAAVPEAFVTAHDAVREQAGLTLGETLLVHGAAGGVGTAALQIGLAAGARVFGTVRSEPAASAVRSLGAEALDDGTFAEELLARTGGRGPDVILELVGAPHFPDNVELLEPQGRIVVVGVGAGAETNLSLLRLMQKRATLRGTVLRARPLEQKAAAIRAFERELLPGLASGALRPLVDSVFDADDVVGAFERLEAHGKVGKVLVDFG